MKKIVFTGGGTLGHVMPNIYLMQELKGYECFYIGGSGLEKEKIKAEKIPYYEIPTTKLSRGKFFKNLKIPFILISAISKAKQVLKEIQPDVIFSKGGYVSLPVVIAGKMLKIPIVAHESDSTFGLSNKIILRLCNTMCVNFKNLENTNPKVTYTGPIFSQEYDKTTKDYTGLNLDGNKPTMMVVGGSLGSKIINENLLEILNKMLENFNIIHITGKGNKAINSYANYNSFEMVDDMVNLYNIADFVLGRAGANVTAECYFKNLPMLLVPLENASSRGDQVLNAEYYVDLKVAKVLKEKDINPTTLSNAIKDFYTALESFKNAYKSAEIVNGKQKVLQKICDIVNKQGID